MPAYVGNALPAQLERRSGLRPFRDSERLRPVQRRHLDFGAQRGLRDVDRMAQCRSFSRRSKTGCSCTLMNTYRSPGGPPFMPGSPLPESRMRELLSTPAGMATFSFSCAVV